MPTTVAANHRPDAEDADGRGARRDDDLLEAFLRLGHLPVDAAKVVEELGRQFDTSRRNGAVGLYLGQQRGRFLGVDLVGDAARDQLAQHRVEPTGDPGATARQVPLTLRP